MFILRGPPAGPRAGPGRPVKVRAHGTHACYVFGITGADTKKGCRCEPCRTAHRIYNRDLCRNYTRSAWGVEEIRPGRYVPAGPARNHLAWLRSQGVGLRAVAERSGVGRTSLTKLASGESRRITARTEDRILAVGLSAAAPSARISAAETWARIDDLLAAGWTRKAVARRVTSPTAESLQLGRDRVTVRHAVAVAELHEEIFPDQCGRPLRRRQRRRPTTALPNRRHGRISTYQDGCGCDACLQAANSYRARYRRKVAS